MRTRRPISLNNSLVHGICNYSCRLCGINKPGYSGPADFQSHEVTFALVQRVMEAAQSGTYVRYLANSGDGEPSLHPEFSTRMKMFGRMLKEWDAPVPPPEISVVTNGSMLGDQLKMAPIVDNGISLIISFPTSDSESYGLIMKGNRNSGIELMPGILDGICNAMRLRAENLLSRLYFHVSPPERDIVRRDFPETVNSLTGLARDCGLDEVELILFPAVSNRSGLLKSLAGGIDTYPDLFRRYRNKRINGVKVRMKLVLSRFFSGIGEIMDLVRSFSFPCIWNANFFIASDGSSICCNDQSVLEPHGNILRDAIETLMRNKESFLPGKLCRQCNQAPQRLRGSPGAVLFSIAARSRLLVAGKPHIRGKDQDEHFDLIPDTASTEPGLASNLEELENAFRLLYKCYLSAGLQEENEEELRISFHNLLPVSYTILVKRQCKTLGTLTLVRGSSTRLPIETLFSAEIDEVRSMNSCFCELSGLAVDTDLKGRDRNSILLSLFRAAFVLGRDFLGCTDFCMMVHPDHAGYYQRIFSYKKIGEAGSSEAVKGAPAIPLWLDLKTSRNHLREKSTRMYGYFFGEDIPAVRAGILSELEQRLTLYDAASVRAIGEMQKDLLKNLSVSEKGLLKEFYPGWEVQ